MTASAVSNNTNSRTGKAPSQSAKHKRHLIKSGSQHHSAAELCESATSYGPDFVSLSERVFCDIGKKRSWPLCENAKQVACFDQNVDKMRPGGWKESAGYWDKELRKC